MWRKANTKSMWVIYRDGEKVYAGRKGCAEHVWVKIVRRDGKISKPTGEKARDIKERVKEHRCPVSGVRMTSLAPFAHPSSATPIQVDGKLGMEKVAEFGEGAQARIRVRSVVCVIS